MDRPGSSSTNDKLLSPGEAVAGERAPLSQIESDVARRQGPPALSPEARQRRDRERRERKEKEERQMSEDEAEILRIWAGTAEDMNDPCLEEKLRCEVERLEAGDRDPERARQLSDDFHRAVDRHFKRARSRVQSRCARRRATRVQRRTRARPRGRRSRRARSSTSSRGSPSEGPGEEPGPAARAVAHSAQALTTGGHA